jgi:hypothetical protein
LNIVTLCNAKSLKHNKWKTQEQRSNWKASTEHRSVSVEWCHGSDDDESGATVQVRHIIFKKL